MTYITDTLTFTIGSPTTTSEVLTQDIATSFEMDGYFLTTEETVKIAAGSTFDLKLNLTCSQGGNTLIAYSLMAASGSTLPAWASIDSSTGKLSGTAPNVTALTTFSIVVASDSVSFAVSSTKTFNLEVEVGSGSGGGGGSSLPEEVITAITVTAISLATVIATCAAISLTFALYPSFSGASTVTFSSLWSLINQLQLLMFLTLLDTFIHEDVLAFIEGYDFVLINFNFIALRDIPIINIPSDSMNVEQPFEPLSALDLESRSTITNCYSLILMIVSVFGFHLILNHLLKNFDLTQYSGKIERIWNKFRLGTLDYLFYAFYTRLFLEAYESLLFASIGELRVFDTSKVAYIFSIITAFVLLGFCLILLATSTGYFIKNFKNYNAKSKFFFQEIYADLRNNSWARIYTPIQILRRLIYALIVLACSSWGRDFQFISFIIFQLAYMGAFAFAKPFEELYSNIIESMNEIFFFVLIIIFYASNSESAWKLTRILTLQLMSLNTLLICLVTLCK